MSAAEDLRAALIGYAPLVAEVADRIYVDAAPEGEQFPFVIFRRASWQVVRGLDGKTIHARRDTFQVECWAETRAASNDIGDLVDDALQAADLESGESDPDGVEPEVGARACVLNVDIWS